MSRLLKYAVIVLSFLALFSIWPTFIRSESAPLTGENAPLIITLNGDQWAWVDSASGLQQLTTSGENHNAVLSPDGKMIAYRSLAQSVRKAREKAGGGGGGEGEVPTDMWLLDLATTTPQMITDTPTSQPDAVIQSDPTWSPDGQFLAWSELLSLKSYRMVIYSMKDHKTRTFKLPLAPQNLIISNVALDVVWGKKGLAFLYVTEMATPPKFYVYSATGQRLFVSRPLSADISPFLTWISDAQSEYLAYVNVPDHSWATVNPANGSICTIDGLPEFYSTSASDGLSVYPTIDNSSTTIWHIANPSSEIQAIQDTVYPLDFPQQLAISPDGKQVAYISYDANGAAQAVVITDGQIQTRIVQTTESLWQLRAVSWGPTAWRKRPGSTIGGGSCG